MAHKIKIGGGTDGWSTWKVSNGHAANIHTTGWEMKFEVDEAGNVSGGNKNDNDASNLKKTYTGTLINNQMNVTAHFSNGQVNQYTGTITGNQFKGTLKLITAATTGKAGDWAEMGGTVHTH